MFRLSRLESATQEIIFLLTIVLSFSLVVGGGFYLFLADATMPVMAGSVGVWFFSALFHQLGYASLLLGGGVFLVGHYLLPKLSSPKDVWKLAPNIVMQVTIQILIVVMVSSLLTVLHMYQGWELNDRLANGAGGWLGNLLGGHLFKYFGLLGSLSFILSFSLVVGIAAGYIELLSLALWLEEKAIISVRNLKVVILTFSKIAFGKSISTVSSLGELAFSPVLNYYRNTYRREGDVSRYFNNTASLDEDVTFDSKYSVADMSIKGDEDLSGIVFDSSGFSMDSLTEDEKLEEQSLVLKDNELNSVNQAVSRENHKASQSKKKSSKKVKTKINKSIKAPSVNKIVQEQKSIKVEAKPVSDKASEESKPEAHIAIKKWTKRYNKPEVNMLDKSNSKASLSKEEILERSNFLEQNLLAFQIKGKIVAAHVGVSLTMYEFQPDPGTKLSKISALSSDLSLILGASSIRVLTPIPGKTTVGIEVPNDVPTALLLGDMMPAIIKAKSTKPLPIALGKNVYNDVVIGDISEMPHLLVSGTTGSGKSVFINTLISGLIFLKSPKELRFIMVDPKMIELSPYNGIPHLLKPVITDVTEAKDALKWAEAEMDKRYQMFADLQSRNISSFNDKIKSTTKEAAQRLSGGSFDWEWMQMPYIVIVVDEMADLMLTQGKEVEIPITRIAQKARAAGIHLVLATQRPSAEIVTGLIKTNFPTRISFKVSSAIDSRTILDSSGGEKLLGKGDMLYMPNGKTIERLQGAFVSEEEVKKIVQSTQ